MSFDPYHRRIAACHAADLGAFEPWYVGHAAAGRVHRDHLALLETATAAFVRRQGRLTLVGDDFAARSQAMRAFVAGLAQAGLVGRALGELYPVCADGGEALLQIDRSAVAWFGVRACGVHLNGFVRTPSGLSSWLAWRARGKRTFPGHLDNLVAGGQSIGMTAEATLCKECHEEAGIPAELAARAVPVGTLAYTQQDGRSLKVDTLACFDLELPPDFVPRPVDGEVEAFELWPVARVAASLRGPEPWKPNCALVAVHFLLRHGALDADLTPDERSRLWRALRGP